MKETNYELDNVKHNLKKYLKHLNNAFNYHKDLDYAICYNQGTISEYGLTGMFLNDILKIINDVPLIPIPRFSYLKNNQTYQHESKLRMLSDFKEIIQELEYRIDYSNDKNDLFLSCDNFSKKIKVSFEKNRLT